MSRLRGWIPYLVLACSVLLMAGLVHHWWRTRPARAVWAHDLGRDPALRRAAARLPLGWLIAIPPQGGRAPVNSGAAFYALLGATEGAPFSTWSDGERQRVLPALGDVGDTRRHWIERALRGGWDEAAERAVATLPLLPGYGSLMLVARDPGLDLVSARPNAPSASAQGAVQFRALLDAMALSAAALVDKGDLVGALAPLADGVHLGALLAERSPDPLEAHRGLLVFTDFLESYLLVTERADPGMGARLRALSDSLASGLPMAPRPSPWRRPAAYLAAVTADSALARVVPAMAYLQAAIARWQAACAGRVPPELVVPFAAQGGARFLSPRGCTREGPRLGTVPLF